MLPTQSLIPFLAQAAAPEGAPKGLFGGGTGMLVVYGLFIAAMWFLMIAPQRKKQKEHAKMLSSIKAGDDILTSGGIYGTVVSVRDDRYVVRIGDSTKVEIAKSFVQAVEKKSDSDSKSS
jgi:preprotein translocase subunit YajC